MNDSHSCCGSLLTSGPDREGELSEAVPDCLTLFMAELS